VEACPEVAACRVADPNAHVAVEDHTQAVASSMVADSDQEEDASMAVADNVHHPREEDQEDANLLEAYLGVAPNLEVGGPMEVLQAALAVVHEGHVHVYSIGIAFYLWNLSGVESATAFADHYSCYW